MSAHLPESGPARRLAIQQAVIGALAPRTHVEGCFIPESPENAICICDRLRACEQRAVLEAVKPVSQAYDEGRAAGVQAARDAVAEVEHIGYYAEEVRDAALAAIDALRNDND